ncbi:hypothetical protein K438DRAFT_543869 [Mycena galopus ATCC 62051]|nr:hypothetical protein K438DRAFT_543869 [Mycena galopus ATCC 62051]
MPVRSGAYDVFLSPLAYPILALRGAPCRSVVRVGWVSYRPGKDAQPSQHNTAFCFSKKNDGFERTTQLGLSTAANLVPTLRSTEISQSSILDGAIYNLTGCTYNITHSTGTPPRAIVLRASTRRSGRGAVPSLLTT